MEEAIFADGFPLRITKDDIIRWYITTFPDLDEPENHHVCEEAIEAVYTMFHGCQTLFDIQPPQIWYEKTRLIFRLLTCWYICDQYPMLVSGLPVRGAVPLKYKKIGGISIGFAEVAKTKGEDLLSALDSNPFGVKAKMMARTAGKRFTLGGNPAMSGRRSWT